MILDQTYGAIQQTPTAYGWNAWTWSIVPGANVVPSTPDQPGLEHTMPENRMHHTHVGRMHHTMPENRMHHTMADEDK